MFDVRVKSPEAEASLLAGGERGIEIDHRVTAHLVRTGRSLFCVRNSDRAAVTAVKTNGRIFAIVHDFRYTDHEILLMMTERRSDDV